MNAVKIPYYQLNPEALHGVIEKFVTRDGTDYGEVEIPLETKIAQVLAVVVFAMGNNTFGSGGGTGRGELSAIIPSMLGQVYPVKSIQRQL
ncbi:YheU family protein [Desulfobacter sp.]|uniref:YheU family protein n=1 Tax=Desulfobacter sp. TaxID=2294 RepID=UPI000E94BA17|nr:YheU family protein [Desulfobacter sp.]HBT87329.1 hypothetical protein [Desulfobacter sp.]